MAQGIVVVGRNRSGTKWLSNQIGNHPDVASVRGATTGSGIAECDLVDNFPPVFGDLQIDDHYYALLACFEQSDYFRLTGLPRRVLYQTRYADELEVFERLMEELAAHRSAGFWLQKFASTMLPTLRRRFPAAHFVVIRRNVFDNIRSNTALRLGRSGRSSRGGARVVQELASYYLHRGYEDALRGAPNVHHVAYEDLVADRERVLRDLCDRISLPFHRSMLEDVYRPNTSFRSIDRASVFTRGEAARLRLMQPIAARMPHRLLDLAFRLRSQLRPHAGRRRLFNRGAFSMIREEAEAGQIEPTGTTTARAPVSGGASYSSTH